MAKLASLSAYSLSMIGVVREDSQRLLAKLAKMAKGVAAAIIANPLFLYVQTQNKLWKM